MRAYARRYDEDEELWGITGLVHDLDYERYPDLETGHPRYALEALREQGYPRGGRSTRSPATPSSSGSRARRRWRRRCSRSTSSPGFIAACALVRPTGIEGMKPKSVSKKLKQPSFAAKVDRGQIERGIDELGVDENEHIQVVIEALAERADELGLSPRE